MFGSRTRGAVFSVVDTVERRWRLALASDGSFTSSVHQRDLYDETEDASRGSWTVDPDGQLTLRTDGTGTVVRTLWKADVIALDGLVFDRFAP